MSKEASPRVVGCLTFVFGLAMIGLNQSFTSWSGEFFPILAFAGPPVVAFGLSVIIWPPAKISPQTLRPVHNVLIGIGVLLGLLYYLLLKFGDPKKLVQG